MPLPTAGADELNPTHHMTLDDGETSVGLMIVNAKNQDDPLAIKRVPYPRMSTQISTGQSKYDDYVPPYKANVGETAEGGRGAEIFEDDKTKFGDNFRAYTHFPGQITLGSMDWYYRNNGLSKQNLEWMNSDCAYYRTNLYADGGTGHRWYAMEFTAPAGGYIAAFLEVMVKCIGTPANLAVELWTSVAGSPGVMARSTAISAHDDETLQHRFVTVTQYTLLAGMTYWLVVVAGATDNAENHWQIIGGNNSTVGKYSNDGAAWVVAGVGFYYRVSENLSVDKAKGFFFDYRSHKYFVTRNGEIYVNGDRGLADDNTGQLTKLIDATKTWTVNQFADGLSYAMIINGPGSTDLPPYRLILSNTATELTLDTPWDTIHTTLTEYIVISPSVWTKVGDTFYTPVTDVAEAGDKIYIAHGAGQPVCYYYETQFSGAWSKSCLEDSALTGISFLRPTRHPTDGFILWAAENTHPIHGSVVHKISVPPLAWANTTYRKLGVLLKGGSTWNKRSVANVTPAYSNNRIALTIGAGVTSGTIIAEKELAQPIDLTGASRVMMMANSTIAQSSSDIELLLSDQPLNKLRLPSYVLYEDRRLPPPSIFFYENVGTDKYRPRPQGAYDPASPYPANREMTFELHTVDYLYVGAPVKFDLIRAIISTANNNAGTLTVDYFDGTSWVTVSGKVDGTESPAGTTLGATGNITWTMPTTWQQGVEGGGTTDPDDYLNVNYFYVRIKTSNNLDAVVMKLYVQSTSGDTQHETHRISELTLPKDASTYFYQADLSIGTQSVLYVGSDEVFTAVKFALGTSLNTINATMNVLYFNGSEFVAVSNKSDGTLAGGTDTLGQDGEISFDIPLDWETIKVDGKEAYWISMYPSTGLDVVDIEEINVRTHAGKALSFPALTAGRDEWVDLALSASYMVGANPDMSKIRYIGLRYDRSAAACTLSIIGDVIYGQSPKWDNEKVIQTGVGNEKITGLEVYGDERANCWVFKEASFGEIQSENDDVYIPVPLFELGAMRAYNNGLAHCTNDVNLIFTLGGMRVEQYFNRTLSDIGPDNGEGLPLQRQGDIVQLLSTPGGIIAGIDAGNTATYTIGNMKFSSVMLRRGSGWHELYRFPAGQRFHQMSLQSVPGGLPSRLWLACGKGDMKCIFVPNKSKNPIRDRAMLYTHESSTITPWITSGYIDLQKLFTFLSAYTSGLVDSLNGVVENYKQIQVDYQLEDGDWYDGWTNIDLFKTSPWEQINIENYDASARRIRLRFRLESGENVDSPILRTWVLDSLLRYPVKYSYTCNIRVSDYDVDMTGSPDMITFAKDKLAILDGWSTPPKALNWRNALPSYDDRYVVLEPLPGSPHTIVIAEGREHHIYQVTLLEL